MEDRPDASDPAPKGKSKAPAVASAFRVLEYLASEPGGAGVSQIARDLKIGKSLCFNVLTTMHMDGVVQKDSRHAIWRLGPKLIRLASAARQNYPLRTILRRSAQALVDQVDLTCLIGQVLSDDRGIVVIDRVLPVKPRLGIVTSAVGQVYLPTAPVFGGLVLAAHDDKTALEIVSRYERLTEAGRKAILQRLESIRRTGYATSLGEHRPNLNAVGCMVPYPDGETALMLCILGNSDELTEDRIPGIGEMLLALARRAADGLEI